jgi:hypothetical protein
MRRFYTIVEAFTAKSVAGETREFAPGEALWSDLQQSGADFKFDSDDGVEWFVSRETFEQCCVLARST